MMTVGGAAWSPYLVGALIGLLSMATFYFSDKPLGTSTAYARVAGLFGTLFSKEPHHDAEILPGEDAQDRLGGHAGARHCLRRFDRRIFRR